VLPMRFHRLCRRGVMNREELATEVQGLIGKCLQIEAECHRLEEVSAAENLRSGRAFLVAAARRLEGPMPWERPPT